MTRRIFYSIVSVSFFIVLIGFILISQSVYTYFAKIQEEQIRNEISFATIGTEQTGIKYLSSLSPENIRFTWITAEGKVLYDSEANANSMENHAERKEFIDAIKTGSGESIRYSSTLLEQSLYYAKRLSDGTVLRASTKRATIGDFFVKLYRPIILILLAGLIITVLLARLISRRIVLPLNTINLEKPLEVKTYEELSPLLRHINSQHIKISEQLCRLRQKNNEFQKIIDNMQEGLIVLDNTLKILTINPTAQSLFHVKGESAVTMLPELDRAIPFDDVIQKTFQVGHNELLFEKNGRYYKLNASRLEEDSVVFGAVLLIFDMTEQEQAYRARKEFTANVSHELKTPLQAIMGSAEIIENGIVKPEDLPRFIGHIRKEAGRLVALVENIIRISRLDEEKNIPLEPVDLYEIICDVADSLQYVATSKGIAVSIQGEQTHVLGNQWLLTEIVYNLCDNGIKYNKQKGTLDICLQNTPYEAILTVKDSGIGIPKEHHARIFERFYRVDKSRSQVSKGTGLGLSIVKHAVQIMGGTIEIHSVEDEGTTIVVYLPIVKSA